MKKQLIEPAETRSGIAAVELAVCLPVILVLILGTMQACSMFYLKQNLSVSAYEGIRRCVDYKASTADVNAACLQILSDRKVAGGSVTISPADFETRPRQTWITVTVKAPCNPNAPLRGWFYRNKTLTASATMMKEF